jgi:hypothetical protein
VRKYKDRAYTGVSAGAYPWVPVDHHVESFALSYAVFHSSGPGQVSANLEGTHDNPLFGASCKAFFLVTANPSTGLTQDGTITQPVMAIRYRAGTTANVSASSNVTFSLIQSGN